MYQDYNGENRFHLYKLTSEDLQRDLRPNQLVKQNLDSEFWQNPPVADEGRALSNAEAGIAVRKDKKQVQYQPYTEGLPLPSSTLREALIQSREFKRQMRQKKVDYYMEVQRRQERARQMLVEKGKLDKDGAAISPRPDALGTAFLTEHNELISINSDQRSRDLSKRNIFSA